MKLKLKVDATFIWIELYSLSSKSHVASNFDLYGVVTVLIRDEYLITFRFGSNTIFRRKVQIGLNSIYPIFDVL